METEYKYVVLRHQPSLYQDAKENFAVLVEGKVGDGAVIFVVGRSPQPSVPVSEMAQTIGRNMADVLEFLIREAVRNKKPQEDVLDWLSQSMSWNFSANEPTAVRDNDPISAVAFKLFSQHVAGADQLVELYQKASEKMIRPVEFKLRLGETFLNLLPVPGPVAVAAAQSQGQL